MISNFIIKVNIFCTLDKKCQLASWDFVGEFKIIFLNLKNKKKISKYLDEKLIHFDNT